MATYNRVDLCDSGGILREQPALAAITPGHLIQRFTGGVRVHATAGGKGLPMFALHDRFIGKTIDNAYAANDVVRCATFRSGEEVWALLKIAAAAVVEGSPLTSNGDGTLKLATGTDHVVAYAEEAIDNSAGASAVRIVVTVA